MTLEEMYFVSQIIAAAAIVGSLLFVALQLKQADKTQRAAMHQNRTQRGMDMALRTADAGLVAAIGTIIRQDKSATNDHILQVNSLLRAMILNLEDVAWQHKEGLLDKHALDNAVAPVKRLLSLAGIRALWQVGRASYAEETAALVERLAVTDVPLLDASVEPVQIWRAIAAQIGTHPA